MIRFVEVEGTPFSRGYQAGTLFKKSLSVRSEDYQALLTDESLRYQVDNVINKTSKIFPDYIEEVKGRAAGAEIDTETYLLMMCPELLGEETGCTSIVMRKDNGFLVLSHNEDDDYNDDNFAITKVNLQDGSWFVTNDPDKMPFGNGYSWNSHGIVKVINYTHSLGNNLEGIPRYFAQRHISEATSLDDFVSRCSLPDRASGYHALALDVRNNKAISVEVTSSSVSVVDIDVKYIHSNHYTHDFICGGKVYTDSDSNSPFRLAKVEELSKGVRHPSTTELSSILQYKGDTYKNSVFIEKRQTNYNTCSNFSIDTEDLEITLKFFLEGDKAFTYKIPYYSTDLFKSKH